MPTLLSSTTTRAPAEPLPVYQLVHDEQPVITVSSLEVLLGIVRRLEPGEYQVVLGAEPPARAVLHEDGRIVLAPLDREAPAGGRGESGENASTEIPAIKGDRPERRRNRRWWDIVHHLQARPHRGVARAAHPGSTPHS